MLGYRSLAIGMHKKLPLDQEAHRLLGSHKWTSWEHDMWGSLRLAPITIHVHLLGLIVLSDEILCQGGYFMLGPGVSIWTLWLVFFGPHCCNRTGNEWKLGGSEGCLHLQWKRLLCSLSEKLISNKRFTDYSTQQFILCMCNWDILEDAHYRVKPTYVWAWGLKGERVSIWTGFISGRLRYLQCVQLYVSILIFIHTYTHSCELKPCHPHIRT